MAQGKAIKYLPLGGVIATFLAFPFLYTNPYILHILILCIIWSVVASAWNLILGYAGVISFGQLAFFTLGAYTVGMLHKFLHISPWIGLGLAGILPSLVGLGIGLVCLRLRGIYVLLITLSLQEIVPVFIKWQTPYTGGAVGFSDMPKLAIGSYNYGNNTLPFYFTAFFMAALFVWIIHKIIKSRIGLAFVALRDSENFARTLGVNDYQYKVLVFIISAFITGVMGGLYGLYIGFATPSLCGWEYVVILLIAIFLGGEGKFPGEIIGTFFIIAATELLQGTSSLREAALGITIILVVFLLPGGLISMIPRLRKKMGNKDQI
jgi:branched-chain amino acid transport system permease protein